MIKMSTRPLTYSYHVMIRTLAMRGFGSYRPDVRPRADDDRNYRNNRPESNRYQTYGNKRHQDWSNRGSNLRNTQENGNDGLRNQDRTQMVFQRGKDERSVAVKFGDERKKVVENIKLSKEEKDEFGTIGSPEILSAESLPDDDDGYDVLERVERTKPQWYYEQQMGNLIHRHSGPHKVKRAMELFEEMIRDSRIAPDKKHYSILITGCSHFGLVKQAFDLFEQMGRKVRKSTRTVPTAAMVTALFNSCANAEEQYKTLATEKATFLREFLHQKAYVLNTAHYNVMVKTFAKLGDMKTAFELVHEMRIHHHPVTSLTFAMLLMGCISDTNSGFSNAIRILRQMDKLQIEMDVHILNLLLRCTRDCGVGTKEHLEHLTQEWVQDVKRLAAGDGEAYGNRSDRFGAKGIYAKYPDTNVSKAQTSIYQLTDGSMVPSVLNHSSDLVPIVNQLVSLDLESLKTPENRLALIGGKDWVFGMIKKYDMKPTVATMTTLLSCLPDNVNEEEELLRKCDLLRIKMDVDFFNILLKRRSFRVALAKSDKKQLYTDIDNIIREIHARGKQVNVMTYGVIAISCGTRDRGLKLIEDIRAAGARINVEIIGALIKNACYTMNVNYLHDLLIVMEEEGIAPCPKVLEVIEEFRSKVDKILFEHENGFKEAYGRLKDENYVHNYNQFKLFYNGWLKRQIVEQEKPMTEQFEFELKPDPRSRMDQFEREMKEKLSLKNE